MVLNNIQCPCGCGLFIKTHLAIILGDIKEKFPDAYVTSGARCETWNKSKGRNYFSYHQTGQAVDITVPREQLLDLYCFIIDHIPEIKGIGFYPDNNFIHIDTRRKRERATWGKLRTGGYISIDDAIKHYEKTHE